MDVGMSCHANGPRKAGVLYSLLMCNPVVPYTLRKICRESFHTTAQDLRGLEVIESVLKRK